MANSKMRVPTLNYRYPLKRVLPGSRTEIRCDHKFVTVAEIGGRRGVSAHATCSDSASSSATRQPPPATLQPQAFLHPSRRPSANGSSTRGAGRIVKHTGVLYTVYHGQTDRKTVGEHRPGCPIGHIIASATFATAGFAFAVAGVGPAAFTHHRAPGASRPRTRKTARKSRAAAARRRNRRPALGRVRSTDARRSSRVRQTSRGTSGPLRHTLYQACMSFSHLT